MPDQITMAMKTEAVVLASRDATAWMAGMRRAGEVADPTAIVADSPGFSFMVILDAPVILCVMEGWVFVCFSQRKWNIPQMSGTRGGRGNGKFGELAFPDTVPALGRSDATELRRGWRRKGKGVCAIDFGHSISVIVLFPSIVLRLRESCFFRYWIQCYKLHEMLHKSHKVCCLV